MRNLKLLAVFGLAACLLGALLEHSNAAPIDDLIAGAKKEGVIEFYGPSTLGPEGAQAIVSAKQKVRFKRQSQLYTVRKHDTGYCEGRWSVSVGTTTGMGHHGCHGCSSRLPLAAKAAETF